MSVRTWTRDSHGLFDYESQNITTDNFIITSDCILVRNHSNIQVSDNLSNEPLLSIRKEEEK